MAMVSPLAAPVAGVLLGVFVDDLNGLSENSIRDICARLQKLCVAKREVRRTFRAGIGSRSAEPDHEADC
jgi:hypothetical protein